MEKLESKKYWVWFSLLRTLGIKKKEKLLEIYRDPLNIYHASEKELLKIKGIGEKSIKNIIDKKIKETVDKHIDYMEKNNIDIINIIDKDYPEKLKKIYDPPLSIYIKGKKEILNESSIGIIGCREASIYGKKATMYFSNNLAQNNIVIVSGLAKGIDSIAHKGAIETNGKTIAVVGTGLDITYPKENYILEKEIVKQGGAIVSEFPLGTKPEKDNFPCRNRIISGLSDAIIVIEAKKKSGTLITVDFALEQGKEVFVVPGNINSMNSVGTNELIKQGANLITNYKEILATLKYDNISNF